MSRVVGWLQTFFSCFLRLLGVHTRQLAMSAPRFFKTRTPRGCSTHSPAPSPPIRRQPNDALPSSTSKPPPPRSFAPLRRQSTSVFAQEDAQIRGELVRAHLLYVERRLRTLRGQGNTPVVARPKTADGIIYSLRRTALLAVGYIVLAALLFGPIEGWSFPDCAYFAIITLTTVGYGDLTPATDAGKVLSAAFAVGGLIVVTASLTELIEAVVSHRRALEVQASLRQIDETTSLIEKAQQSLRPTEQPDRPGAQTTSAQQTGGVTSAGAASTSGATAAHVEAGFARLDALLRGLGWSLQTALPLLLAICGGTCLGYYVEGWCAVDSAYFALISILTVGYGDFSPSTRLGRTLCTLLLPVACAASLRSVSRLGAALDYGGKERKLSEAAGHGTRGEDARFERMGHLLRAAVGERGDDGLISEADYVCTTLLELELVDPEVLDRVREQVSGSVAGRSQSPMRGLPVCTTPRHISRREIPPDCGGDRVGLSRPLASQRCALRPPPRALNTAALARTSESSGGWLGAGWQQWPMRSAREPSTSLSDVWRRGLHGKCSRSIQASKAHCRCPDPPLRTTHSYLASPPNNTPPPPQTHTHLSLPAYRAC